MYNCGNDPYDNSEQKLNDIEDVVYPPLDDRCIMVRFTTQSIAAHAVSKYNALYWAGNTIYDKCILLSQ
jgi:hypothetical protein